MPVIRKTITLEWLEAENACTLEACRRFFADKSEIPITAETLRKGINADVMSCNWLAKRILTGPELAEYEKVMQMRRRLFEMAMSRVLIEIIERNTGG